MFGKKGKFNGNEHSKFNGNPDSNFHAGQRNELLTRRQQADEAIRMNLQMKYGIQAQVASFHQANGHYGVMITVPNYSSAMTVQSAFYGEQTSVQQEGNSWIVTITE